MHKVYVVFVEPRVRFMYGYPARSVLWCSDALLVLDSSELRKPLSPPPSSPDELAYVPEPVMQVLPGPLEFRVWEGTVTPTLEGLVWQGTARSLTVSELVKLSAGRDPMVDEVAAARKRG